MGNKSTHNIQNVMWTGCCFFCSDYVEKEISLIRFFHAGERKMVNIANFSIANFRCYICLVLNEINFSIENIYSQWILINIRNFVNYSVRVWKMFGLIRLDSSYSVTPICTNDHTFDFQCFPFEIECWGIKWEEKARDVQNKTKNTNTHVSVVSCQRGTMTHELIKKYNYGMVVEYEFFNRTEAKQWTIHSETNMTLYVCLFVYKMRRWFCFVCWSLSLNLPHVSPNSIPHEFPFVCDVLHLTNDAKHKTLCWLFQAWSPYELS